MKKDRQKQKTRKKGNEAENMTKYDRKTARKKKNKDRKTLNQTRHKKD